jgi:alpha-tubulin suppressor-like RCC1 family protein
VRVNDGGVSGARRLTGGSWRLVCRLAAAAAAVVVVPVLVAPAGAAGQVASTRVVVLASPATVHVGSTLAITGSVSPPANTRVVLQRLIGTSWHTLGSARAAGRGGGFSFAVRVPGKPAGWVLRVTRAGSATARAGVSGLLHVRVVTAAFVVKATADTPVVSGSPVVVVGSVAPKAIGSVVLQRLVARTWVNIASARMTPHSTFRFATVRPVGVYKLRVVKAFTARVAGGVSNVVSVAVATPPATLTTTPAPPTVTTSALPLGTVGVGYTTTLTASGGAPPYVWTASGLPAGLVLSAAGVLSGTPTTMGGSPITIAVTDSALRTGTAVLTLTVAAAPRPAGRLLAWGSNDSGQLGNDSFTDSDVPVPVTGLNSVYEVAGGANSAYALRSDGTVWAWGSNSYGQLGNDTSTTSSSVPVPVSGLTATSAIAGGDSDGYALRSDGTVWAWGLNGRGQLGDNAVTDSDVPVQVSGLTSVTAITAGRDSGYALRSDGTVWAWGFDDDGPLGNSTATGSVPAQVSGLASVIAIAAGDLSMYALRSDGTVWASGSNRYGELGNGTMTDSNLPVQVSGLTSVTSIAGGQYSGYALRSDGTVWAWGSDAFGQLGNNATFDSVVLPVQVIALTSVSAIAGGFGSGYALPSDGTVWAWGTNRLGQLGNGTTANSHVPAQASGLTGVIGIGSGPSSASAYAIEAG